MGHSGKSRKAGGGGGNMVGKLRVDMEDGKKKTTEQLLEFAARLGFAPGRVESHPSIEAGQ